MSAGIEIYNYVSNQKGSPALYSDIFANRPAAGFLGRLFISTDTLEIYRDTGTAWALISGGGGGVNIYNSDGTLTAARTMTMANHSLTFEGGANDARLIMSANNNVPRIFSFRTANVARWDFRVTDNETGSDAGGNWYLRAHNDAGAFTFAPITANRKTGEKTLFAQANITAGTEAVTSVFNIAGITYAAGLTMIGGNAHAAQFNNFTLANSGSLTFANSSFVGANGNVLRLQANSSGTITMQAASPGLRAATASLNQIQYNTTNGSAITYTHAANIQGLGILQLFAAGSLTVTNGYGLLLNDLNEYGYPSTGAGALSITNRWGIYQDSTTDANYLGGSVLIGTTTNAGYKTDINGTFRAVSTVTLSSLAGTGTRMVVADATGILSTQAIPGGGGISGSGTTNYIPKFTSSTSIGNSAMWDAGTAIGINTTTPAYNLDVLGNSRIRPTAANGYAFYCVDNATNVNQFVEFDISKGAGSYTYYRFASGGNNIITWGANLSAYTEALTLNSPFGIVDLQTSNTSKVRIFNGGNVSIGSTTDAGVKLFVNGSGRIGGVLMQSNTPFVTGGNISEASGNLAIGTTASANLNFYTNNTFRATFPTTGEFLVGGTLNPYSAVNRGNLTITGTSTQILAFTNNTAGTAYMYYNGSQLEISAVVGALHFLTDGTYKGQFTANGNFLVGTTTNSGQRLQVAGTARIFGTALPHLLIEQTAATGNVELQFSATDASYPAIIRSKAAQSIAFKDGTNSNLDIYSAGQLSIGGGGAPFGSTNTITVLAGTAPTATASDCFTLYSKDITAGNAAPHFITENGAIVKIYQETTSVAAAAFTANSGTAINDASTFDGYTLRQIVKALRNLGILN